MKKVFYKSFDHQIIETTSRSKVGLGYRCSGLRDQPCVDIKFYSNF